MSDNELEYDFLEFRAKLRDDEWREMKKDFPYEVIIKFEYTPIPGLPGFSKWTGDGNNHFVLRWMKEHGIDMRCDVADVTSEYIHGRIYRFKNAEHAILFKLTFG
jgi:hypothetical protein